MKFNLPSLEEKRFNDIEKVGFIFPLLDLTCNDGIMDDVGKDIKNLIGIKIKSFNGIF